MFVARNFEIINWEHVEFVEGTSQFLHFLVEYHILSETETWPFLRLLRTNSSEMQYRRARWINSERKNRPSTRYVYGASFTGEHLRHRTRSNKVKARCFMLSYAVHVEQTLTHVTTTTKPVKSSILSTKPVKSSILYVRPCMDGVIYGSQCDLVRWSKWSV